MEYLIDVAIIAVLLAAIVVMSASILGGKSDKR